MLAIYDNSVLGLALFLQQVPRHVSQRWKNRGFLDVDFSPELELYRS
ncbi:hypothetical protein CIPAW_12G086600 [Carya illinoinensis]|uniref:Uncharacterized protein n=1 Tax=Carya illinoinensis TaxID=32201 RepID=A0A8T1NZ77_CARIL|nr:hypothetical protein CIPAW_12G086600 [Carya illinoinensis]